MSRTFQALALATICSTLAGCAWIHEVLGQKSDQAGPVTPAPLMVQGPALAAIAVATDDFRQELKKNLAAMDSPELASELDPSAREIGRCLSELGSYDLELLEEPDRFRVSFRLEGKRCSEGGNFRGGGALYQIRKLDHTLLSRELPE